MMTLAEEIDKICRIDETDIKDLTTVLISLLRIGKEDDESLRHQGSILSDLIIFLEQYLDEKVLDKNDKLAVVKILDKINVRKELIELKLQGLPIDFRIASERLGKKSQSALGEDDFRD